MEVSKYFSIFLFLRELTKPYGGFLSHIQLINTSRKEDFWLDDRLGLLLQKRFQ